MPKKKANTITDNSNDKEQVKLEQIVEKPQEVDVNHLDNEPDKNIDMKSSELASRIVRELYRHYGVKDSHTNKHLYQQVMFEVAMLSGKPLNEVMDKWPKFDIFSILDKVKEATKEELKNEPTIMYKMVMNNKLIADRILAKVIVKSMFC